MFVGSIIEGIRHPFPSLFLQSHTSIFFIIEGLDSIAFTGVYHFLCSVSNECITYFYCRLSVFHLLCRVSRYLTQDKARRVELSKGDFELVSFLASWPCQAGS